MSDAPTALRHPSLAAPHAFGTRDAAEPPALCRPRQVHGNRVVVLDAAPADSLGEADAVISNVAGLPVGIVTADCVPILLMQGDSVAAIHAGWRGLACGVIEAVLDELARRATATERQARVAVIGPHICPRHYEIDTPVRDALETRYGAELGPALQTTRSEHWQLDLRALSVVAFRRAGWEAGQILGLPHTCTFANAERFASRRRDGAGGERLVHWIAAPSASRRG